MKSVLQAGWLLTVAIGNFIVLIVAELAKFPEQVKKSNSGHKISSNLMERMFIVVKLTLWDVFMIILSRLFRVSVGRVRSVCLAPAGRVRYLLHHGLLLQVHRPGGN